MFRVCLAPTWTSHCAALMAAAAAAASPTPLRDLTDLVYRLPPPHQKQPLCGPAEPHQRFSSSSYSCAIWRFVCCRRQAPATGSPISCLTLSARCILAFSPIQLACCRWQATLTAAPKAAVTWLSTSTSSCRPPRGVPAGQPLPAWQQGLPTGHLQMLAAAGPQLGLQLQLGGPPACWEGFPA